MIMRKTYQSAMNKVRLEEDRKQELLEQICKKIEYKTENIAKEADKRFEDNQEEITKETGERKYVYMLEKKGKWRQRVCGVVAFCCVCFITVLLIGKWNKDDKTEITKQDDFIATEEIKNSEEAKVKTEPMEERIERISNEMKKSGMGVCMPQLVYLSDDTAMIHHYIGFLIYDRKKQKVVQVIDTKTYGINQMQGDDYTEVFVSKDGALILFVNIQSEEKRYLYHVEEDYLEQTTQTRLEEPYNEVVVRGSEKDTEHIFETIHQTQDGIIGEEYIKTESNTCWFLMLSDTSEQKLNSLVLVKEEISKENSTIYPIFDDAAIGKTEKVDTSDNEVQTQTRHYLWEYDGWKYYYCNWTLEEAKKEGIWDRKMGRVLIEMYGRIEREKEAEIQIIEHLVQNFSSNGYSIPRILDADEYMIYIGSETSETIDMKSGTLIVSKKDGSERNCYPNWNKGADTYFYDNNYIYYSNSWQMKEGKIRICRMNMDFSKEMLWNEVEGTLLCVKDGYAFYIRIEEENSENEGKGVIYRVSLKQYDEKPVKEPVTTLNLTKLEMDHYENMEIENLYAITEKAIYSKDYFEPIEFTIYNKTYAEYQIQENGVYNLEIKIGDYWYRIKEAEQKQTEKITKTIQANQIYKTMFHLSDYIENEKQRLIGQYRIVKTLKPEQENLEPVVVIAEFMIQ